MATAATGTHASQYSSSSHEGLTEDLRLIHSLSTKRFAADRFADDDVKTRIHNVLNMLVPATEKLELADLGKMTDLETGLGAYGSPMELVIVDTTRPQGISSKHFNAGLPAVYDPNILVAGLSEAGFSGTFIQQDIGRSVVIPTADEKRLEPPPLMFRPLWSAKYEHLQYRWPMLPPTLCIKNTSRPVLLSMPHPAHMQLQALIYDYCVLSDDLASLVSTLCLWTRSWGLVHFSRTLLALMAIHWYQRRSSMQPNLMRRGRISSFWVHNQRPSSRKKKTQAEIEIASVVVYDRTFLGPIVPSGNKATFLWEFFQYWAEKGRDESRLNVLSIETGGLIPRKTPYSHKRVTEGHIDADAQPVAWSSHRLIVPDPFLPQFNHAHEIPSAAFDFFGNMCMLACRDLKQGYPALTLFGPHLNLFRGATAPSYSPQSRSGTAGFRTFATHASMFSSDSLQNAGLPPVPVIGQDIQRARSATVTKVEKAIQGAFGHDYTVACFGSTVYGVSTPTSDLDLVILDRKRDSGFAPSVKLNKLPPIYNVNLLSKALRTARFQVLLEVPTATVPIVKFRDLDTMLNCDINVNDQLGLHNSLLIARYCELQPHLRQLIFVIKCWAKSHGFNNPSGRDGPASFSSYALTMMTIGLSQMKGLLPTLQTGLKPLPDSPEGVDGIFWLRNKDRTRVRVDYRFHKMNGWQSPSQTPFDVTQNLLEWFRYWAYEHSYDQHLLSTQAGRLLQRKVRGPKVKASERLRKVEVVAERRVVEDAATLLASGTDRQETTASRALALAREATPAKEDTDTEENSDAGELIGILSSEQTAEHSDIGRDDGEDDILEDNFNDDYLIHSQPKKWNTDGLVVVDPFILSKNIAGSVGNMVLNRFIAECERALFLMMAGRPYRELLGKKGGKGLGGPVRNSKGKKKVHNKNRHRTP